MIILSLIIMSSAGHSNYIKTYKTKISKFNQSNYSNKRMVGVIKHNHIEGVNAHNRTLPDRAESMRINLSHL